MLAGIRRRLTYANVMATIAVFIGLSGGAYAAFNLPKNSVKSKHIVDSQVKGEDVDEGTLERICPKGLDRVEDICFEQADHEPNGWVAAWNSCGNAGLRLPTSAESFLMATELPVPAPETTRTYWTQDNFEPPFHDGNANALNVNRNSETGEIAIGPIVFKDAESSATWRCITSAH